MSNHAFIIPTKFENLRTGDVDYGFRVFDDYAEANVFPFDLEKVPDDDLECLRLCLESEYVPVQELLDHIRVQELPITIGSVVYSWEDIKDCFEESEED